MSDKNLIIADGHHRYETALNYRNEMRQQSGQTDGAPYDRVMMTLVNMDSKGLVVLPTHRVVFGLDAFDESKLIADLQKYFEVEKVDRAGDLSPAMNRMHETGQHKTALLAVTARSSYPLRAKDSQQSSSLDGQSAQQRTSTSYSSTNSFSKKLWECRKKTSATRST